MKDQSIWDFKIVDNKDRSFQTVEVYHDKVDEFYNYDNNVPNYKKVKIGDIAILRNKKYILGISQIENITSRKGKKSIPYCLICGTYDVTKRVRKKPIYRCPNGHESDTARIEQVDIVRFKAIYPTLFIDLVHKQLPLKILKPYYLNPNPSNSIQDLDVAVLKLFPEFKINDMPLQQYSLPADEGLTFEEEEIGYRNSGKDERATVSYQIKVRRGQTKFRNDLRKRYGDVCMVTGCKILDIIEAAHINPYRGENDNHVTNGLLLRSDIHTLFDLNLIGLEPKTLMIHVHNKAHSQYKTYHKKLLLGISNKKPSKEALESKWNEFLKRKKIS